MTKRDVIRELCAIMSLAYQSRGRLDNPSDGVCDRCAELQGPRWTYQNSGEAIDYVRQAVVMALKVDGFRIAENFDVNTGREKLDDKHPTEGVKKEHDRH